MGRRLTRGGPLLALALLALWAAPLPGLTSPRADWAEVVAALDAGELDRAYETGRSLLADSEGALELEAQQAAFRLGVALVDADRFERAAEVQTLLFERVPAEWSAINASLTLARIGRVEEADAVLAAELVRRPRSAELWNQRGVMWLGAGDQARARRHLGRAVRYGSLNASLSLGRLALLAGDLEAARAAFRPGVDRTDAHAWGLRGWAATLLPAD
jgi:tetratricopeptide (TPR) repeat protein